MCTLTYRQRSAVLVISLPSRYCGRTAAYGAAVIPTTCAHVRLYLHALMIPGIQSGTMERALS